MLIGQISAVSLAATLLAALPASANDAAAGRGIDHAVPIVAPGEEIGIACNALQASASANDVRVVLTIAAAPKDAPALGYSKVLATNEKLTKGAVRVRIPEMPDLANRTVSVNVYVVNGAAARNCNGGHVRIAARSEHSKGKQS